MGELPCKCCKTLKKRAEISYLIKMKSMLTMTVLISLVKFLFIEQASLQVL